MRLNVLFYTSMFCMEIFDFKHGSFWAFSPPLPTVIKVPAGWKLRLGMMKCQSVQTTWWRCLETGLIFVAVVMLWFKVRSRSRWAAGTGLIQQNWLAETWICPHWAAVGSAVSKCDTLLAGHMDEPDAPKELGCSVNPLKVKYKWNIVRADVLWKVAFILIHKTCVQMIHFTRLALFFHRGS